MPSREPPEFSPHIYNDLKEHLREKDQDRAIELINQLLSSGRPLGEIIAEIMPPGKRLSSSGSVTSDSQPPDPPSTLQSDPASVTPDTSEPIGLGTPPPTGLRTIERLMAARTGGTTADPFVSMPIASTSDQLIELDTAAKAMPAGHDQAEPASDAGIEGGALSADLAIPAAPYASGSEPRRRDRDKRQPLESSGFVSRKAQRIALCLAAAVGLGASAFIVHRNIEVKTQAGVASPAPTGAASGELASKASTTGIGPQDETATITLLKVEPEAPPPTPSPVPEARSLYATETAPDSTAVGGQAPGSTAVRDPGRDSAPILERGSSSPTGSEPASGSAAAMKPALPAVMEPPANAAVAKGSAPGATGQAAVSQIVAPTSEPAPQRRVASETEIAAVLSRGDTLLTTGDIASARLFYRYGADAGDGAAALRLAATFDPAFLKGANLPGIWGDPAKAAHWYSRARDLGNAEVDILLKSLEPPRK